MAEYIDREAVVTGILNDLEPLICRDPASVQVFSAVPDKKIISYLEQFPAADVRPVVRSQWKKNDNGTYFCEWCHSWIPEGQRHYANYCLYCGADMREEESTS